MSTPRAGTAVGTVAGLARYPVKGMIGETLENLRFGWHGPEGDRAFAFLRMAETGGLPFLSPRRCPGLCRYTTRTTSGDPVVMNPDGDELDVRDPRLLHEIEHLAGERLHLVRLWSHATDSMDVSLITNASVTAAGRLVGCPLNPSRFRPNLVVDTRDDHRDHPEDRWIGRTLKGGDNNTMLHVGRATQRCTVINIDPKTGLADTDVFATIRGHRKNRLGVYATIQRPGTLTVGDALSVHH
ncbi:MAG: MOSC domain-containing protein [Actinomycetota bacterium]|nr:MOSC domain-containing protein [Actinomycetota bacterium]